MSSTKEEAGSFTLLFVKGKTTPGIKTLEEARSFTLLVVAAGIVTMEEAGSFTLLVIEGDTAARIE